MEVGKRRGRNRAGSGRRTDSVVERGIMERRGLVHARGGQSFGRVGDENTGTLLGDVPEYGSGCGGRGRGGGGRGQPILGRITYEMGRAAVWNRR